MSKRVCVIIPCAGEGSRLATPYPKELTAIGPNRTLIDECLSIVSNTAEPIRIVLIVNKEKLELIRYLDRYKDLLDLNFVFQKSEFPEMIGAIRSASNLFLKHNLVLLPDTIIKSKNGDDLINQTIRTLEEYNFLFWVKKKKNTTLLKREGAVVIEQKGQTEFVTDYVDKPSHALDSFSGYWAAFAFNKVIHNKCLDIMDGIIRKDSSISYRESILKNSPLIEVEESFDLGVWTDLLKYYSDKLQEVYESNYI